MRRHERAPTLKRRAAVGAAGVSTLLFASVAAAQLAVVGLEYRAPPECPARETFVRELEARTERVRAGQTGSQGTLFVEITGAGDAARGQILFREASGRETERSVSGASCKDVVDALALIAVVLLDPEAQSAGSRALAAAEAAYASAPATASGPASTEARGAASENVSATPQPPADPYSSDTLDDDAPDDASHDDGAPDASRSSSAVRWRFGAGAGAGIHAGTAPNPPIGFGIDVSAERRRAKEFGLTLGLTLNLSESDPVATEGGDADFSWVAVRAWVCPVRWPSQGIASLAACAGFEGGVLSGTGYNTVRPETQRSPWLAPALFGRGEVRPVDMLTLSLEVGLSAPLVRGDFYFDQEIQAYKVPSVAGFALLGVRLQAE